MVIGMDSIAINEYCSRRSGGAGKIAPILALGQYWTLRTHYVFMRRDGPPIGLHIAEQEATLHFGRACDGDEHSVVIRQIMAGLREQVYASGWDSYAGSSRRSLLSSTAVNATRAECAVRSSRRWKATRPSLWVSAGVIEASCCDKDALLGPLCSTAVAKHTDLSPK